MISRQNSNVINDDNTIQSKGKLNDTPILKSININDKNAINSMKTKRKKIKYKTNFNRSEKKENTNNLYKRNTRKENDNIKDKLGLNIYGMNNNINSNDVKSIEGIINIKGKKKNKHKIKDNDENRGILKKIQINRCLTYLCFLCARKRNNIQNILLDEGMKIIIEKLDIMNLFKKIYRDEKLQEKLDDKEEYIEMSDECKNKLFDIYKNTLYGF
jgi:hypothetical protein